MDKIDFFKSADFVLNMLNKHKQAAIDCDVKKSVIDLHNDAIGHIINIQLTVKEKEVSENYLSQFLKNINSIQGCLPYGILATQTEVMPVDENVKLVIENHEPQLLASVGEISFNIDFFTKAGYLNNNIVAIGANGSGKTSLSKKFREYMQGNGVVISAQRILLVPSFDHIQNPLSTLSNLRAYQTQSKTYKDHGEFNNIHTEFEVVLKNLISQNNAEAYHYKEISNNQVKKGEKISPPTKSGLERTIEIWNTLIEHRKMRCLDGMNIVIETENGNQYPAIQMSDGEKVILFLIAQVLQAPIRGFIIIDEPEMYLHKTILKKLWDFLEKERADCIFIYLTHDLDFATSRITAKKIWVKSFTHPDKWELENIPENELPEALLLELLGSRKNILFCEGVKGSIDEKVFNLLFPHLTIVPVEDCNSVINYTKAFNKIGNLSTKALGIIDSDHHGQKRLQSLEKESIYCFAMAECENIFLDEEFLKIFAAKVAKDGKIVEEIKEEIITSLSKEIELQCSNYVSAKINYYFKESHVSKGNTIDSLNENYKNFSKEIDINKWFQERNSELKSIIEKKDYRKILSLYNNKGLKSIANKHLRITDFTERAVSILQMEPAAQEALLKHFPKI